LIAKHKKPVVETTGGMRSKDHMRKQIKKVSLSLISFPSTGGES
jgi:hypothetical protein